MIPSRPFYLALMALSLSLRPSLAQEPQPDGHVHGLLGGVGLSLIFPHFENNPAYIVNDKQGNKVSSSEHVNIRHQAEVAPQVWLGYLADCGLGGRARYWTFDAETSQSVASPNRVVTAHPAGLSLIADHARELRVESGMTVHAIDLEALQAIQSCTWDFLLSAGVRIARVQQSYDAIVNPRQGMPLSLFSQHTFDGAGPVVAAEARRMLGETGLSLFGSVRGSVVFGAADQTATIPIENNQGSDHRDRGMLIGEMELGLEYGHSFREAWLFGQVALVGQNWFGAGSASRSTMLVTPGGDVTGGGYTVDSDLAFLGVTFRFGVNY